MDSPTFTVPNPIDSSPFESQISNGGSHVAKVGSLDLSASFPSAMGQTLDTPPLMADDPWNLQPNSSSSTISSALSNVSLPLLFERTYKLTLPNEDGEISVAALDKVISSCGLPKQTSNKILYLVLGMNQTHITKEELFVILGLIALAQKNMSPTLDNLKLYRDDLPEPSLTGLETIDFRPLRSPALKHRSSGLSDPWRGSGHLSQSMPAFDSHPSYKSLGQSINTNSNRSKGSKDDLPPIEDDIISLTESPQLGGLIFRYVNYIINSKVRGCEVTRRYSDFYWLSELLAKRYPYRMLPKLPPKKFGGSKIFFNDRLKGLTRFLNFLVVHPVLKEDSMVNTFLTEPSELSAYRVENQVHTFEEFEFNRNRPTAELATPNQVEARKAKAKETVDTAIRQYEKICITLDRISLRQQASGKDYQLFGQALSSLADQEVTCSSGDALPTLPIFSQFNEITSYLEKVANIMNETAEKFSREVLEGFRMHYVFLIALKELFDRIEKIPDSDGSFLKSKIVQQQVAVDSLSQTDANPGEIQRLQSNLEADERAFQDQLKRNQFLQQSLWQEMDHFHARHHQLKDLYSNYVASEADHHGQVSRVWKQLALVVDTLPATMRPPHISAHSPSPPPTFNRIDDQL